MPVEAGWVGRRGSYVTRDNSANFTRAAAAPDPQTEDLVMLVRPRKSRIYFLRRFFDYPISLTAATFRNMGPCPHSSLRHELYAIGIASPARGEIPGRFIINASASSFI